MRVDDEGLVLTSRSRRGWTATFIASAAYPSWEDELIVDRWAPWRWLAVWRLRGPVRRWIASLPPHTVSWEGNER